MRRWLEANPTMTFAAEVRAELNIAPKRYVTYARECFGWGVFASSPGNNRFPVFLAGNIEALPLL